MITIRPRVAATVAIPDTGEKTLFLDETDSVLKTKDDAGVVEALATADATEPKVYVALLTQIGTDAPVATILKNTLGGVPVWSYEGVGNYNGTLTDAFPINKTNLAQDGDKCPFNRLIYNDMSGDHGRGFIIFRNDDSIFTIKTTSATETYSDNILSATYIIIEVYP